MACQYCHRRNCSGGPTCKSGVISRDNTFTNNSEGRDGESAYAAYVRAKEALGEIPLSYNDWALYAESNIYNEDNWE